MTTINRLLRKPNLEDDDLFVIWSGNEGRTRSLTPEALADYIQNLTIEAVTSISYANDVFSITYSTGDTQDIYIDRPQTGELAPEGIIEANGSRFYMRVYVSGAFVIRETYYNQNIGLKTGWMQTASFSEAL